MEPWHNLVLLFCILTTGWQHCDLGLHSEQLDKVETRRPSLFTSTVEGGKTEVRSIKLRSWNLQLGMTSHLSTVNW